MEEIPEDNLQEPEYEFRGNLHGPWNNLEDQILKREILNEARQYFNTFAERNENITLETFIDIYTAQWLEFKGKVEEEAVSNGFQSCKDLSEVSPHDRYKVAILALTINGSFVLLGNGCLTSRGSTGRYERMPFRIDSRMGNKYRPYGVFCKTEPAVGKELSTSALVNTSPLYLLYYTTDALPGSNELRMADSLSCTQTRFITRMSESLCETVQEIPRAPHRTYVEPEKAPVEL